MRRMFPRGGIWRLAMLLAAVCGCPGTKSPDRGYGESCRSSDECLAGRECVQLVTGREWVCGETCVVDDECATRAHPDAHCGAGAEPSVGVCVVPCTFDDACPGDLVCGSGGWCVPSGPEWVRVAGPMWPSTAKVDVLVLIDNSGTMAEEQDALGSAVGGFLDLLFDPPDINGDGLPDRPAVEDINLGVISSDMGTGGFMVRGCSEPDRGDDGCLQSDPGPRPGGTCAEIYPRFLSRNPSNSGMYTVEQLAQDFACLAYVGVDGCGFEQSLSATRKALLGQAAPGGCDEYFLRPDSILVLLFVTDEDDCSVRADRPDFFDALADLGELNLRCFLHPELLDPPSAFQAAFTSLRVATPERLVLGVIAGVPPDVGACQGHGDALDACLDQPEMAERVDPVSGNQLLPSCDTRMGRATPPRRLVELARLFGRQAAVGSICALDWGPTMERVAERVAAALPGGCFPEDLPFEATTCRSTCRVLEVLSDDRPCAADPECTCAYGGCTNPRTLAACEPLRRDAGTTEEDGAVRRACILRQATRTPARGACSAPADAGWYFIPESMSPSGCPVLSFETAGVPLLEDGSVVYIECGPAA